MALNEISKNHTPPLLAMCMTVEQTKTCGTCKHRQRWIYDHVAISYCTVRKSNRTQNGMLKIKARQQACDKYEASN